MRSPVSRAALGILLLAITVSPNSALPDKSEKWMRIETTNFTLFSNAGKKRAVSVGKKLEQLREVLSETSQGMTQNSPLPTRIFVFKDTESFELFALREDGTPANMAGYFVRTPDGNYVAVDASAETLPYAVIYHEYLHYFLENNVPGIPLWLNEGIAEFYSTFNIRRGRVEIGLPVIGHLVWFRSYPLMTLDQLFTVDTSSKEYNEGTHQSTYYAQSWALAHYLLTDPARRAGMDRLLNLVGQGVSSTKAFNQAFGIDLLTAEKQLQQYVSSMSDRYLRYTPKEAFDEQSAQAFPMERKEVLYRLGDLLVHSPPVQIEAAEEHLRGALALDASYTDPLVSLAKLRLIEARPEEAVALCDKALRLNPDDTRARVLHGKSLIESFVADFDEAGGLPKTTPTSILQARQQFRQVLAVEPDHVEALIGFGRTFMVGSEGELDEGIAALALAVRARPARVDALQNLIVLTARSGNVEGAKSLLNRSLRPRGEAEAIQAIEAEIVRVELGRVQQLLAEGKSEEAIALARQVADGLSDPTLKQTILAGIADVVSADKVQQLNDLRQAAIEAGEAGDVERARELLLQLADQVGELEAGPQGVDLFNEATRLANAGDLEGAIERFERVADTTTDPELKSAAASYAEHMSGVLRHNRNVDRYNGAIAAINGNKPDEAIALLTELLDDAPQPELQEKAERLMRTARRAAQGP